MASSAEEPKKRTKRKRSISNFFQIAVAFAIVFFPLIVLAILLCLFVTTWTIQNPPEINANLPVESLNASGFFTTIYMGKVSLTSSFAPNIAQFAMVPFLLLFSYLVALDLVNQHHPVGQDDVKMLHGDQKTLFVWAFRRFWNSRRTERADGTKLAGIGALISLLLTGLILIGDKALQGTLSTASFRVYYDNSQFLELDSEDFDFNDSFRINSTVCPPTELNLDLYDNRTAPPCSIDTRTNPPSLWDASATYRVPATGLLNQTNDFHEEDFDALWNAFDHGTFGFTQLVTHIDQATQDQHIFFFNPMLAQEDQESQKPNKLALANHDLDRYGLDYIANTTSVVTKCFPITLDCGMRNVADGDSSVEYCCSDIFGGNIDEVPTNGIERLKGWNTTFFNMENGSPRQVTVASQMNPFHYNVTAVVDSINLDGLVDYGDLQVDQGTIVGIGTGRVGFALSCNSTVYDVTYALVDGNINVFNTTLADPRTAAIIKGPLQAGFGSYALFEKAALSVLANDEARDSMELAFSQTFLALVAGVYERAPNLEQRTRGDMTMTQISKAPFCFLVVCMFIYAFVGLVFTVIALSIFRRSDIQEVQARLISENRAGA